MTSTKELAIKHDHLVAQSPDKPAQQLLLLFHGVGDDPVVVGETGNWFAPLSPDVLVISIGSAEPSGNPAGRQWFLMQGTMEDDRRARVDAIMPTFVETAHYQQKRSGVGVNATVLIGFSQDAIMVLESIKTEPGLASCAIAFNRCYASLSEITFTATTIHLIHDDEDPVIDLTHAVAAQKALINAGDDMMLDTVEDLDHTIGNRNMQLTPDHLRYTIPKHYFGEVLSGGKPGDDNVIEIVQKIDHLAW